ncbi:hypothetical protein EYF80_042025 [Liparis tanakae]|uniref:Uncharacterized protein n=1 Tax=Liparis tanakae TaxID=230148 RepID=A0A4Z2G5A7_9TELE|nr:hypothetical protein EYF80_042025 [Liparis tanakae]
MHRSARQRQKQLELLSQQPSHESREDPRAAAAGASGSGSPRFIARTAAAAARPPSSSARGPAVFRFGSPGPASFGRHRSADWFPPGQSHLAANETTERIKRRWSLNAQAAPIGEVRDLQVILREEEEEEEEEPRAPATNHAVTILIALGAVMLVVVAFGDYGACNEKRCALLVVFSFKGGGTRPTDT